MKKYLLIKWTGSDERVEVELGPNPKSNEIRQTKVKYHDIARVFVSITTSTRTIETNKSQKIRIHHSRENYPQTVLEDPDLINAFGPTEDWFWGTSTITVAADLNSAQAEWNDDNPENNDEVRRCAVLPKAPLEEGERKTVERIKRRQDDFRDYLLFDCCCAITGEETQAALDAAHIVAAAEGGREEPANGILLRADMHRLYDARLFENAHDGAINRISDELSNEYKELLQGKKVSQNIISRISEALAERARMQQGR